MASSTEDFLHHVSIDTDQEVLAVVRVFDNDDPRGSSTSGWFCFFSPLTLTFCVGISPADWPILTLHPLGEITLNFLVIVETREGAIGTAVICMLAVRAVNVGVTVPGIWEIAHGAETGWFLFTLMAIIWVRHRSAATVHCRRLVAEPTPRVKVVAIRTGPLGQSSIKAFVEPSTTVTVLEEGQTFGGAGNPTVGVHCRVGGPVSCNVIRIGTTFKGAAGVGTKCYVTLFAIIIE